MTRKSPRPTPASPHSVRGKFAHHVQRVRKQRDLSQEQLAEMAGYHRTYISQVERAIINITADGLERICVALEVDVRDLLSPIEDAGQLQVNPA